MALSIDESTILPDRRRVGGTTTWAGVWLGMVLRQTYGYTFTTHMINTRAACYRRIEERLNHPVIGMRLDYSAYSYEMFVDEFGCWRPNNDVSIAIIPDRDDFEHMETFVATVHILCREVARDQPVDESLFRKLLLDT